MFRPLLGVIALVFAMIASASRSGATAPAQRIVAVGDLHGDYSGVDGHRPRRRPHRRAAATGRAARPILVQLGDITDRGAGFAEDRPQPAAAPDAKRRASGGKVIVVLGNHEAMNLLGDYRYTTPGEYAAFADDQSAARREQLYAAEQGGSKPATAPPIRKMTAEQVREAWMAADAARLGRAQARLEPDRANSAAGRRAIRRSPRSAIPCSLTAGSAPNMPSMPLDAVNKRVAAAMAAADDSPARS